MILSDDHSSSTGLCNELRVQNSIELKQEFMGGDADIWRLEDVALSQLYWEA